MDTMTKDNFPIDPNVKQLMDEFLDSPNPSPEIETKNNIKMYSDDHSLLIKIKNHMGDYSEKITKSSEYWTHNHIYFHSDFRKFNEIMNIALLGNSDGIYSQITSYQNEIIVQIKYEGILGFESLLVIKNDTDEINLLKKENGELKRKLSM
jgi:hypothetical protein